MMLRALYDICGTVQGVGFRPAVYRLARDRNLGGWIQNRSGVVRLCLEGGQDTIEQFLKDLPAYIPSIASMSSITLVSKDPVESTQPFCISKSESDTAAEVSIPADLATCPDCLQELFDQDDRRYGYPFTTCTNCGPRYTVVHRMPYDRERTTLAEFPLCPECLKEYEDPMNRRFHAESTACSVCGPHVWLCNANGHRLDVNPVAHARQMLAEGHIIAVRGMGGYLLAVDALNPEAVEKLRNRKKRPHKPFAVMARNIDAVREYCEVPKIAESVLTSPQAPIVILGFRNNTAPHSPFTISNFTHISPDTENMGIMLPTTPLHHLLFQPLSGDPVPPFDLLVMTSGNHRGEPICIRNQDALERLSGIADYFLCHNREINLRCDDSLAVIQLNRVQLWRRSRGYAPEAIQLPKPLQRPVLAMGAELKNTIALGYDSNVVLSPHIGDLETPEAIKGHRQVIECFPAFLDKRPSVIAVDLHPDMHSTVTGRSIAADLGIPVVGVQHHHAHAAACMAEHGLTECLALAFDGTGIGPDGKIWGAELLHVSPDESQRLATFEPVPLPGGDAAVIQPARQLIARLHSAGIELSGDQLKKIGVTEEEQDLWKRQMERHINAPVSHAAGRVFDAFSVVLGLAPNTTSYDGQSAIRLEAAALQARHSASSILLPYSKCENDHLFEISWAPLFREYYDKGIEHVHALAMSFHLTMAKAACEMVEYGVGRTGQRHICLTGGVFMNRILTELITASLRTAGLTPYIHRLTPPNDGCIALGQAVVAGNS